MIETSDLAAMLCLDLDLDESTTLEVLEPAAVAFFQSQTNRHFGAPTAYTEYLDGADTPILWLEERPSSGLAADVTVISQPYEGGATTAIVDTADDGFVLRSFDFNHTQMVRKGGGCWARNCEYVTTYNRGYVAGEEPADVRQAIADIVALMFADAKAQAANPALGIGGITSETLGRYAYELGGSGTAADPIDVSARAQRVLATIAAWRRNVAT